MKITIVYENVELPPARSDKYGGTARQVRVVFTGSSQQDAAEQYVKEHAKQDLEIEDTIAIECGMSTDSLYQHIAQAIETARQSGFNHGYTEARAQ